MLLEKKFAIYYRDIPQALEAFISKDKFIKHVKDGVKNYDENHKCPRLTVIFSPSGNHDDDKRRLKSFTQLLDRLENNNQIIGYSG